MPLASSLRTFQYEKVWFYFPNEILYSSVVGSCLFQFALKSKAKQTYITKTNNKAVLTASLGHLEFAVLSAKDFC